MRTRYLHIILLLLPLIGASLLLQAQETYSVTNPQTWTASELAKQVGKTLRMQQDWYISSNSSSYTIAPRRVFTPTNQVFPRTGENTNTYDEYLRLNQNATVTLTSVTGYHRTGERIHNLIVKVNSTTSLTFISGEFVGNTRQDILQGPDTKEIDRLGEHTLLVCGINLRYYLTSSFSSPGPTSASEHTLQREKVSQALALINADIYGIVEVQQGQEAVAEIAADLTRLTGRTFTYINDGTSVKGTFTKAAFVYSTETVTPYGELQINNTQTYYRKMIQAFTENASGEQFVLSVSHFKAKSATATGQDADQGDGQSTYNATRVKEAQSVWENCQRMTIYAQDSDILLIGDLNAYAKEDPVQYLVGKGLVDMHRTFHGDSSYSYTYRSEAGYLDHALCSPTLLPQVTGMQALHINADEDDRYRYNGSWNDHTPFRCSDHDPILIGLHLNHTRSNQVNLVIQPSLQFNNGYAQVINAPGGYVQLYDIQGNLLQEEHITSSCHNLNTASLADGLYIVFIGYQQNIIKRKLIIR